MQSKLGIIIPEPQVDTIESKKVLNFGVKIPIPKDTPEHEAVILKKRGLRELFDDITEKIIESDCDTCTFIFNKEYHRNIFEGENVFVVLGRLYEGYTPDMPRIVMLEKEDD
jgi:hypothetical protein